MCPWGETSVIDPHSSSPAPRCAASPSTKDLIRLKGQKGHPRDCHQHGTSCSEPQHPPRPCPAPPVSPVGGPGRAVVVLALGFLGSPLGRHQCWEGHARFAKRWLWQNMGSRGWGWQRHRHQAPTAPWPGMPAGSLAHSHPGTHCHAQTRLSTSHLSTQRGTEGGDAGEGVRDADAGDFPEGPEPCQEQHPAWRNPSMDEPPPQETDGTWLSLAWLNPACPPCLCTVQPWLSHRHPSQSLHTERKQDLSQLTETTRDERSSHGSGFPRHSHLPSTKSLIMCAGEYVLTSSWLPHMGSATTTRWL